MSNLIHLQKAFQARLLNRSDPTLQQLIVKSKSPSTKARINIYADAYNARLIEALHDNYSRLSAHIGQKKFEKIAQKYITKYPSYSRFIQSFGNKLSCFLQEHYPEKLVLAELAKFEWAIGHTFDAADEIAVKTDHLRTISANLWPNMKFNFHPSVRINNFNYNIITFWENLLNNRKTKATKLKKAANVIFWRNNLESFYRKLTELETSAITIAINGGSFAQICEIIGSDNDESSAATKAVTLLIQWLNAGLICQIRVNAI